MSEYTARTTERVTYADLTRKTGLSQTTLESIASRSNYDASLRTLGKLCRALGCQPEDLLALIDDAERE